MHINVDKAKEIVRLIIDGEPIEDLHLQPKNKSLTGFWHVAELWPKLVKINLNAKKQKAALANNKPKPKSNWVNRIYLNRWKHRFMSAYERYTLHESVLWRLEKLSTYRPENIKRICNDISKIKDKFDIEKWERLD